MNDKWSEIKIFEGYDDSDSTYLFIKLTGMANDLKMNKKRFMNYPQVIDKIKKLSPGQIIRYRTTLQTYAGDWKDDEWFSDVEAIDKDSSTEVTQLAEEASRAAEKLLEYVVGATIYDKHYGKGIINQVEKIGMLTVLTIKFDDYENTMRKVLNLEEMSIVDKTK